MSEPRRSAGIEVTPLSQRIVAMGVFRVVVLAVVALLTWSSPSHVRRVDVLSWVVFLALGSLGLVALVVRSNRLAVRIFGAGLLTDAVFLQFWHDRLGHAVPIDAVVASLLVCVCLLASHRTGLKLAVWQSLLMVLAWRSEQVGLVPNPAAMAGLDRASIAMIDMVLLWTVVLTTSVASSINERELRRRRYDAEALRAFALDLMSDQTEPAVLERLSGYLRDELLLPRMAVIRRDPTPGGARLRLVGGFGLPAGVAAGDHPSALIDLALGRENSVMALRLDPARDPFLTRVLPGAQRVLAAPLRQEGRAVVAVVEFPARSRGGRVERRILSSATQACATGALALARAELLANSRREAMIDGLTGLANRRSFDQNIEAELQRAHQEHGSVALVLSDVDFFKKVNDVHGHQMGDQVLQVVGRELAAVAQEPTVAARYGGEEFALILPGIDDASAAEVAEQVRTTIMGIEDPLPITMSFGVAAFPKDAGDVPSLILAADAALLAAKAGGRNQVHRASTATTALITQRHS